jgi:16S rRNA (uracil1498-N3)-methyltransferase
MIRLALNVNSAPGQVVALSISDQHYLRDVMRKKVGDALEVLALDGSVWRAQIGENGAVVQLLSWAFMAWTPDRYITLYQALLKGDHFGEVVDRATQAGVSRFVPLITERTIVRELTANRVARWQALAREASGKVAELMCRRLVSWCPLVISL